MPRPISIVPSVLPADFSRLGDECMNLEKAGVDRIQFDVMDGVFVPNLTFGPDVIASVRPHVEVPFEAHLMVVEPDRLLERYVEAGCGIVIVHAEACAHLHRTLARIGDLGATPGLALSPHPPAEGGSQGGARGGSHHPEWKVLEHCGRYWNALLAGVSRAIWSPSCPLRARYLR